LFFSFQKLTQIGDEQYFDGSRNHITGLDWISERKPPKALHPTGWAQISMMKEE
jgi:hypothetical protein